MGRGEGISGGVSTNTQFLPRALVSPLSSSPIHFFPLHTMISRGFVFVRVTTVASVEIKKLEGKRERGREGERVRVKV